MILICPLEAIFSYLKMAKDSLKKASKAEDQLLFNKRQAPMCLLPKFLAFQSLSWINSTLIYSMQLKIYFLDL